MTLLPPDLDDPVDILHRARCAIEWTNLPIEEAIEIVRKHIAADPEMARKVRCVIASRAAQVEAIKAANAEKPGRIRLWHV
jgi:hypothetical protein